VIRSRSRKELSTGFEAAAANRWSPLRHLGVMGKSMKRLAMPILFQTTALYTTLDFSR
jgi:hypothetical protein